MSKQAHSKANRLYTEPEVKANTLLGRFERLVMPDKGDIRDIPFTELQSLALENLCGKLKIEIERMSNHIADLEISSGVAKFAGEK